MWRSKIKGTNSFFRPLILTERLRELNKRMGELRPAEIVETLTPEFFEKVKRQKIYDGNVKLKQYEITKDGFIIREKLQSTTQFSEKDKFEDMAEHEERKAVSARGKGEKGESAIEDKDSIKEALERQRRSPWIARIFITIIIAFLLGLMVLSILGHVFVVRLFSQSRQAYKYAEISTRKTAELLYIKNSIRSLIFQNTYAPAVYHW